MKNSKLFNAFLLLVIVTYTGYSQDYHVRIAFIGNSITIGDGLANPSTECYPAQLRLLLQEKYGDTCVIRNFAVSGRTMLKNGDYPFWINPEFMKCWYFAPEILFICMGTNDSKPQNWDIYGNQFYDDYKSMIDTFKVRNPFTKFIVCYPPPAYKVVYDIRDPVILNGVIPAVDSIVAYAGATLVDFYHPLRDSVSLFPDFIHPGLQGSRVMAELAYDTIIASDIIHKVTGGLTFVNSLNTDKASLALGDSATLSWITFNADSVFLNGQIVAANGSLAVSPKETSIYTLVAKGEKSVDSVKLEQHVYVPFLNFMIVSPKRANVFEGDSVDLKLTFFDQLIKIIPNPDFDVVWSINEGDGRLINETDISVTFIADSTGKAVVAAWVDTVYISSTITVKPIATGTHPLYGNKELNVFPNPVEDNLNIKLETIRNTSLHLRFFNLKGTLVKEVFHRMSDTDSQTITIKTEGLETGIYFILIKYGGKLYAGQITKQ